MGGGVQGVQGVQGEPEVTSPETTPSPGASRLAFGVRARARKVGVGSVRVIAP